MNSLNQYTQRTVPGYTAVMGTAHSNAVVTLVDSAGNSARALRQQEHFFGELPVTNYLGPVWLGITNYAVLDTETEQVFTNNSGAVLVPPTPQVYSHDGNGNLTSDGLWIYHWDAENRMTRVESGMGVPAHARKREDWTYLPDGRWIERIVSTNNGSAYYPAFTNRFVWDGKVLLAILDNNNEPIMTFLRGADLSGTIEGAGGVGGVLAVNFAPSTLNPEPSTHFLSYDGNGNVIALTDAATAETTAVFEYGPFGELLRATGPMADQMPLRFSTMYADDVTGDVKYLYRDLTTPEGRWTSRDPIGDYAFRDLGQALLWVQTFLPTSTEPSDSSATAESPNLYIFVLNQPGYEADYLGLWELRCRTLSGIASVTAQRHCWIECDGHSYSLLNNDGSATKIIDDPRDKGRGTVVESGAGRCNCIIYHFYSNNQSYKYDESDCNSNYYAGSVLACCGIDLGRPSRAWGWGNCSNSSRKVRCACGPFLRR